MKHDVTKHDGPAPADRAPERTQTPAPGKVTRTGKLSAGRATAVQRKRTAGAPVQARALADFTADPWMDAAHRGLTAFASSDQRAVQAHGPVDAADPASVRRAAAAGVSGSGGALPHLVQIQAAFGTAHDLGQVRAHVGGGAREASEGMGAQAYATGEDIAFRSQPDLHTAAHEAAHVVQQRAGVQLSGGVGQAGDSYERQADAVADRVVQGRSAADLLGGAPASATAPATVQRQELASGLCQALGADSTGSAAHASPVQLTLATDLRGSLDVHGPVDYDGIVRMIHAAPVAERQAVLADTALRDLINQRLNREWASTVFSSLMEGSQTWQNPPANEFYTYFVTNHGTGTLPSTATMNCWESIIYAAYLARLVSAAWIETFYQTAIAAPDPNLAIWTTLGFSTSLPTYAPPGGAAPAGGARTVVPRAGQLLFYHTGGAVPGHVAVSLGGDQAMSLWNQPNNVDSVQRIAVTQLAGTVYVGDSPW